jgi:hypothetical protein
MMIEVEACPEYDKRAALRKALESQTFARSEQLKSFLRYVCEAEFRGASGGLTEYVIGVEVLHRPNTYSPAEDSSVRTRAYDLRQKLEKLYSGELQQEPVHIVIPKGSYAPQFVRVGPPPAEPPIPALSPPAEIETAIPTAPRASKLGLLRTMAALLVAALAGGLAVWSFERTRDITRPDVAPILRQAWEPFAKHNGTALLIAATPLYMVLGPETHTAFHSNTYPAPPEAYPLFQLHRPLPPNSSLGMVFTEDALGVGSMNAVLQTSNVVRALGATPQVLPERPAMMSMLHGRDAILFGAPVDSQAITELMEPLPLSVVYDPGLREFVVADRLSNRVFAPEKQADGDFRSVYGLVTVLNTREGEGGRLGTVIFSGVTSVGTHGAAEFFTSPDSLLALRALFEKQGLHGFPLAYQVVVKCRIENMLLVESAYETHRVLNRR